MRPYSGASLADAIDVRGDSALRATARGSGFCGLATCFGASTTTLGSAVVAPPDCVAVCAIAVPLRPHSGATARLATKKSDENFTAIPPISGDGKRQSQNSRYHWPDANLSHGFSLGTLQRPMSELVIRVGLTRRVPFADVISQQRCPLISTSYRKTPRRAHRTGRSETSLFRAQS